MTASKDSLTSLSGRRARAAIHRKVEFLRGLRDSGNVSEAAKRAGVARQTAYEWRENVRFARMWDGCMEIACDALEKEARRRAIEGVEEPVFHKGEQVGTIRRYSDRMLEILLKANRPEKFRERFSAEFSGPNGGPIAHEDRTVRPDSQVISEAESILRRAALRRGESVAVEGDEAAD